MRFQIFKPVGFLANFVKEYCFMEADAHEGAVVERVIPTEHVQLMFHYKDPFIVYKSPKEILQQPRSIVSGLTDSYFDVSTNGDTGVVFISFYPEGACNFFDFPLSEIGNQSIDLKDVFYSTCRELEEKLFETVNFGQRITLIERFLQKNYKPIPVYDKLLIEKSIEQIKHFNGNTTVSELSEILAVTTKSLERKCSKYLGKPTKQVIQLFRFQSILQDFSKDKNASITDRAYRNGYFDQSHFIKDFKKYCGYTPGEFLEKYPDY